MWSETNMSTACRSMLPAVRDRSRGRQAHLFKRQPANGQRRGLRLYSRAGLGSPPSLGRTLCRQHTQLSSALLRNRCLWRLCKQAPCSTRSSRQERAPLLCWCQAGADNFGAGCMAACLVSKACSCHTLTGCHSHLSGPLLPQASRCRGSCHPRLPCRWPWQRPLLGARLKAAIVPARLLAGAEPEHAEQQSPGLYSVCSQPTD